MIAGEIPHEASRTTYVVVPAYNEATCLANVLRDLKAVYPQVVVVNDGSTDDTGRVAQELAPHALHHLVNRGQGAALQTGIEYALGCGAEYIVTFDADDQHRVDDISALLAPLIRGECEVALGSRFLGETVDIPKSRRLLLSSAVIFTRLVNGLPLTDVHNGLRAFTKEAAQQIKISMDGMAHASELLDLIASSGLKFKEIPVQIRYTEYSLAKGQSARNALRVLFHYIVGRVTR